MKETFSSKTKNVFLFRPLNMGRNFGLARACQFFNAKIDTTKNNWKGSCDISVIKLTLKSSPSVEKNNFEIFKFHSKFERVKRSRN